jgi:1-acyl-sn-glycerol-3-phosphate acyltransferase
MQQKHLCHTPNKRIHMNNAKDHVPENAPRFGNAFTRWIGRVILWFMGYKISGQYPNEKKLVMAAAPHTSNWDLLLAIGTILAMGVRINFMMKKEAFDNPLGWLFKILGGIPVDRSNPKRTVVETLHAFKERDKLWLAILPEGTRKPVKTWKAGFIRIARTANVPILIKGLDGENKILYLDKVVQPALNSDKSPAGSAIAQAEELRLYCKEKFNGMNPKNE